MTIPSDTKQVSRRKVLYFAGFDPRGAAAYHTMTSQQFAKHCAWNNLEPQITKRERGGKTLHTWVMGATGPKGQVTTDFQFLVWDDLVRANWIRPDWRALLAGTVSFAKLVKLGTVAHMLQTSRPTALTVAGPFIYCLLIATLVVLGVVFAAMVVLGMVAMGLSGIVLICLVFFGVRQIMSRFNAPWMGRITTFAVKCAERPVFEQWAGRNAMAEKILDAIRDSRADEVLVVSHSIGTQIALLAMADALTSAPTELRRAVSEKRICFVTIGQTVPFMSWTSKPVEQALKTVGESTVPWLDVSAPADPACYVLVDPYRNQFEKKPRVHVENARFFKSFNKDSYREAQADRFTMHFLYLKTPDAENMADRKSGFDFYALMTTSARLVDGLSAEPRAVAPYYAKAVSA